MVQLLPAEEEEDGEEDGEARMFWFSSYLPRKRTVKRIARPEVRMYSSYLPRKRRTGKRMARPEVRIYSSYLPRKRRTVKRMARPEVRMFWYSSRPITLSVSQLVYL